MRYSSSTYMGRTDSIDPTSLAPGDRVTVHVCDTSATSVWSYPATARLTEDGTLWLDDGGNSTTDKHESPLTYIDGCYMYLTVRRGETPHVETALPRAPEPPPREMVYLQLDAAEHKALTELATMQGLSQEAILRQALRCYQL